MLFHSPIYLIIFLPLVVIFYYKLNKFLKIDNRIVLGTFGLIFYSWWNVYLAPLIVISILFNYYISNLIIINQDRIKKKRLLLFSIFLNVIYLGIFKYTDFIIQNINALTGSEINEFNIPFPLAMSFFTFQTIAFLVDCYDDEISKNDFKKYSLFIIFFPQLVAGPIVKYNDMIPQFENPKNQLINKNNIILGLIVIIIGLFKKVVIADTLSINVDAGFNNYLDLNFIEAWIVSLSFTFQLYFDFSGYIDMATGSAILFNIRLPQNFDSPFKATSLINFWQRWHITLFKFLMNYIYFPWIRSLKKITYTKAMLVTFCVFIISGIWHGPTWGYVMFGVLHGIGLIINHTFNRFDSLKLYFLFGWFLTMFWVNLTLVFFRSEDLSTALHISKTIFGLNGFDFNTDMFNNHFIILSAIAALIIVFCFKNTNYLIENHFKKSDVKI